MNSNPLNSIPEIVEGVDFGGFVSQEEGMVLISRSAPTPSEKVIEEPVPFMQGKQDFGMFMGERIFENRPLTYTFHLHESNKQYRSFDQTQLENQLMRKGISKIKDTYSPDYYYMGKCLSVNTEDDHIFKMLIITIEFDCYPFKIKEVQEGSPYWDDYDISDYYQKVEYTINETETIQMMNTGTTGVAPEVVLDSQMTLTKDGEQFIVPVGTRTIEDFRFEIGMNTFTVTGNGTIKFNWHKEVI